LNTSVRFTPTSFLFAKKAVVRVSLPFSDLNDKMEAIMDAAIELGAEDIINVEEEVAAEAESVTGNASLKPDPNREVEVEVSR